MFLEGEVNWVLVLGLIAAVTTVLGLTSFVYAVTHRTKQVSTADQLLAVSRAREEAETRLYETLNAIPVALVQTDRGGKFVFANRAAHALMGRKDAELLGLRFHSATWGITFPDGRPIPPDMLPSARALRGQTVKGFQHILMNPAQRRKMLVSVTAMPIEDSLGQIIGSTAAIVETEGLATTEPLAAEILMPPPGYDDVTRRVFDAASSALIVVGANGVVREANAMALDLIGGDASVVGADFADGFLAEHERVEGRQALRAAAIAEAGSASPVVSVRGGERGIAWRVLPLPGPSGTDLLIAGDPILPPVDSPVEAEAVVPDPTPLTEAAEPASDPRLDALSAELAIARAELVRLREEAALAADTARAETLAQIEAQDESARRLESVGRLTGGVAQDFNALLSVMTSALDMMLKAAEDPSRVRRLGQAALAAGQRGEALTRRLSAFSQGEEANGQVMDVGLLLRGLEMRLRALAGPGVDLMIEAPAAEAPVRLDPVAFEAAVTALVRNAVEAMEGAGALAVRSEVVDGRVRISVRDTGPGLDADTAQRAVEPFFTTRFGREGLGLAQTHAFARQWGGGFTLTGAEGEGAEAVLTLPIVRPEALQTDSAA